MKTHILISAFCAALAASCSSQYHSNNDTTIIYEKASKNTQKNEPSAVDKKKYGCIKGNCENGLGEFIYAEGKTYNGYWKNRLPNGKGSMQWPDGRRDEGDFENGFFSGNGLRHDNNGAIIFKFKGEEIGQVKFAKQSIARGLLVGGFYLVKHNNILGDEAYLIDVGNNGELVWNKSSSHSKIASLRDAIHVRKNEYIFVGSSRAGDDNMARIFYSNGLSEKWSRALSAKNAIAAKIIQVEHGQYMVIGEINKDKGDSNLVLSEIDSSGNIKWEKEIRGGGSITVTSLIKSTDGNYILTGKTEKIPGPIITNSWVIKVNHAGDIIWNKLYSEEGFEVTSAMASNDGGIYIIGNQINQKSDKITNKSGKELVMSFVTPMQSLDTDIFISKLDKEGRVTWEKRYGEAGKRETLAALVRASNGNLLAVGGQSKVAPVSGSVSFDSGLFVAAFGDKGDMLWKKTFDDKEYGQGIEIIEIEKSCYVVIGDMYKGLYLLKINNDGNLVGGWQSCGIMRGH